MGLGPAGRAGGVLSDRAVSQKGGPTSEGILVTGQGVWGHGGNPGVLPVFWAVTVGQQGIIIFWLRLRLECFT